MRLHRSFGVNTKRNFATSTNLSKKALFEPNDGKTFGPNSLFLVPSQPSRQFRCSVFPRIKNHHYIAFMAL